MILGASALGGLLVASPTSRAHALGYTSTDIDVPGIEPASTAVYGPHITNLGQIAGRYFNSDGFPYTGGKSVTIHAP
jgi:hypothetical protein